MKRPRQPLLRPAAAMAALLACAAASGCGSAVIPGAAPAGLCPSSVPAATTDSFSEPVELSSGPSGLEYGDLRVGCGALVLPPTANVQWSITFEYTAWLPDGRELGTSRGAGGQPVSRPFAQLLPGLQLGFLHMRVGGKRRLVIPPALGFGSAGQPPLIPPNATLVWDVDVLGVASGAA